MVASSGMYVALMAFLVGIAAANKQPHLGIYVVVLLICALSVYFFFQGLCDCEAAHLKEIEEVKPGVVSKAHTSRRPIRRGPIHPKKRHSPQRTF